MLNNTAAFYIETGNHDKAITFLQKSLRLWEEYRIRQTSSNHSNRSEIYYDCTLDGCIAFSEQLNYRSNHRNSHDETTSNGFAHATSGRGNKRRRISIHKSIASNGDDENCDPTNTAGTTTTTTYKRKNCHLKRLAPTSLTEDSNLGYTYHNPIRVPKCHRMIGSTCFFIIMYNLALATHLKALNDNDDRASQIDRALKLYELIFEFWSRIQGDCNVERENDTATSSLRFVMILFNNMSQLYKMVDNPAKQKKCLELLLSTVMVCVEWNTRATALNSNGGNTTNDSWISFQQSIEGFLTNAMPPQQCAHAA